MEIHAPFIITARLMAGVHVGGGYISIGSRGRFGGGRTLYQAFIDLPDGTEHEVTDLKSGMGGGDYKDGMESLLSFLGAAAESFDYRRRTGHAGENEDLFPAAVVQWAHENADELSMLESEIRDLQH